MSREAVTWLNGVMFTEPKNDGQRKVVGGRLNFWTNEESVDKFCDQLKAMTKMHREIGEDFLSIDIMRNDPSKKLKFDFKRSDWSSDDSLKQKVENWKTQGSSVEFTESPTPAPPAAKPEQSDPFAEDGDITF